MLTSRDYGSNTRGWQKFLNDISSVVSGGS